MKNPFNVYQRLLPINNRRKQAFKDLQGFETDENSTISLNLLRSLPLFEWHHTENNKIHYCLIRLSGDEAEFLTVMDENAAFGLHEHDCIEKGIVLEGHLIDVENGLLLKKNEEWIYEKDQDHKPFVKIRSIYQVVFSEK